MIFMRLNLLSLGDAPTKVFQTVLGHEVWKLQWDASRVVNTFARHQSKSLLSKTCRKLRIGWFILFIPYPLFQTKLPSLEAMQAEFKQSKRTTSICNVVCLVCWIMTQGASNRLVIGGCLPSFFSFAWSYFLNSWLFAVLHDQSNYVIYKANSCKRCRSRNMKRESRCWCCALYMTT